MYKILIAFPLLIVVAACSQSAPNTDNSPILAGTDAWEAALNERDIETLVSLYTDDARVLPPNGKASSGIAAVRSVFGGMLDAGLIGEIRSLEAKVSGDIGYNVGIYILETEGGMVDQGKFIETWQRGADGKWRISNDIFNSDLPAAAESHEPVARMMILHEVGDAATWLAAWRGDNNRHQDFAKHGAGHVHVLQNPEKPNQTGLFVSLDDPDVFDAWLQSKEGQAAAAADTVKSDTITVLMEVR